MEVLSEETMAGRTFWRHPRRAACSDEPPRILSA